MMKENYRAEVRPEELTSECVFLQPHGELIQS